MKLKTLMAATAIAVSGVFVGAASESPMPRRLIGPLGQVLSLQAPVLGPLRVQRAA